MVRPMANAPTDDRRLFSPSTARNREPIHAVLEASLVSSARVLELASGSGEHAVYMAERHPDWRWQPSDVDDDAIQSIEAWRRHTGLNNMLAPQRRDLLEAWVDKGQVEDSQADNIDPDKPWDAMVAINLVHISPWAVTERLMFAAQRHLVSGGVLFLYGPYRRGGEHTAPSNAQFDAWLKARDPRWGVRDLEQVVAEAADNGLTLQSVEQLPANNLAVIFRRD